jgi:hypothetical protein
VGLNELNKIQKTNTKINCNNEKISDTFFINLIFATELFIEKDRHSSKPSQIKKEINSV